MLWFEPWLSGLSGLSGPVGPLSSPVGGSVGLTGLTAVGAPVGWVSGPVGDLSIFLTATMCVPCRGLSGRDKGGFCNKSVAYLQYIRTAYLHVSNMYRLVS